MHTKRRIHLVPALVSLALLVLARPGDSQAGPLDGFSVGPRISSVGWGVEVSRDFTDFFTLRAGPTFMIFGFDSTLSGVDYATDVEFINGFLIGDFHPLKNGLRISGGVFVGTNTVDFTARPSGSVTIGGQTFAPGAVGRLNGEIDLNTFAPYVGLGYSGGLFGVEHLAFDFELGMKYGGAPDVTLTSSGAVSQADLNSEEKKIENQIDFIRFYPVVTLGLSYRF
ncbi:MAG: hypothetical protein V3T33_02390 [Myxococcota bacterium]